MYVYEVYVTFKNVYNSNNNNSNNIIINKYFYIIQSPDILLGARGRKYHIQFSKFKSNTFWGGGLKKYRMFGNWGWGVWN